MATCAPAPAHVQFKQLCQLKTCPDSSKKVYQNPTQLIAVASFYGLIFVGERSGLKIIDSRQIFDSNFGELNPKNVIDNYRHRNIPLPSAPSHIELSSDQQVLAGSLSVAFCKDGTPFLRVYTIRTFLNEVPVALSEVKLSSVTDAYVTDLSWNPTIHNMLTCCISDRTVSVYTFNSYGSFKIKSLPKESNSVCVCWSPNGQQLIVGNTDGYLIQYSPELMAMKIYSPPHEIFKKPCTLCRIKWLSTYQFIGVYKLKKPNKRDGDPKSSVIVINTRKDEPVTYMKCNEISLNSGTERPSQFHFLHIEPWNMIFVASSNAVEVLVLKQSSYGSPSWCKYELEDSERIKLPMSGVNETFLVGIAIDYSSPAEIPTGKKPRSMPIISVLTCDGLLCLYDVNYLDQSAPNICVRQGSKPWPWLRFFTNDVVTNEELFHFGSTDSDQPRFCDKSPDELRSEGNKANRHRARRKTLEAKRRVIRQLRPPAVLIDQRVSPSGNSNERVSAAENIQLSPLDSILSEISRLYMNCGTVDRRTTVEPENVDNAAENSRGELAVADSHEATQSDNFEDYALKLPLEPLPLTPTSDSTKIHLSSDKLVATRTQKSPDAVFRFTKCSDFVTICSQLKTDQLIVIQILKVPNCGGILHLHNGDMMGHPFSESIASSICKLNDVFIIWLNEEGKITVIKAPATNDGYTTMEPIPASVNKMKSGQCSLLANLFCSIDRIRAFIGDRKDAEPFLRNQSASISSTLPSQAIQSGFSLSLICELQDNKITPINFDYSGTQAPKSEKINPPTSFKDDEKLCKICMDNGVDAVLLPCFHACLCYECGSKMKDKLYNDCPICRTNITSIRKLYFS